MIKGLNLGWRLSLLQDRDWRAGHKTIVEMS